MQIRLRRGDDLKVDRDLVVRAEPLDDPLLQHAQQPHLRRQRHGFDLIEEKRAAMGMLDLADALVLCPSKGASLVAEQFRFQHGLRDRAAIDRDEAALAAAEIVQRPRRDLLARARLTEHENIRRRARDALQPLTQRHHRRRMADQPRLPAVGRDGQAQTPVLDKQTAMVAGPAHGLDEMHRIGRLLQKIPDAIAHRAQRHRDIAVAGHQDDRDLPVDGLHGGDEVETVPPRHAHIRNDDRFAIGRKPRQRRRDGTVRGYAKPLDLQKLTAGVEHIGVVVNEDDVYRCGHAAPFRDTMKRVPPGPVSSTAISAPKSLIIL